MRTALIACALLLAAALQAADEAVRLWQDDHPSYGWELGTGPEFPGATGTLQPDPEERRGGTPSLRLAGDFTQGGNYVQASAAVPKLGELESLSFWLKAPGAGHLTIRLSDSGGMTHQLTLKLDGREDWQLIRFQADAFFNNRRGESNFGVQKYEKWGGPKNGAWNGQLTAVHVLCGRNLQPDMPLQPRIWFADMQVMPKAPAAARVAMRREIHLDPILQAGELAWAYWSITDPKGGVEVVADQPAPGQYALRLWGSIGAGGGVVAAAKSLGLENTVKLEALKLHLQSDTVSSYSLQVQDGSGQTHQRKGLKLEPGGQWQELVYLPGDIAGGEHWGGANDGKWHDPIRGFAILLNAASGQAETVDIRISDVRAAVQMLAPVDAVSYRETFDAAALPAGWTAVGDVRIVTAGAFAGTGALQIARTETGINAPVRAEGPLFAVTPGAWQATGAGSGDLYAPDNSFHGRVSLQVQDAAGQVLETPAVYELPGKGAWTAFATDLDLPAAAAQARFVVELAKTYGEFRVDELGAVQAPPDGAATELVTSITLKGAALGHLFLPDEPLTFTATVETYLPLAADQQTLQYRVTDYWGAELGPTVDAALTRSGFDATSQKFTYSATFTLDPGVCQIGAYYELHASVAGTEGLFSTFARLPPAATHAYPPEQVPFNIRGWDNRIPDYIRLSHRLGIRQIGIWTSIDLQDPTQVKAHTIELCEELGAGWVGGIGAVGAVERGSTEWTPEKIRIGTKALVAAYKDRGMVKICLGNEPHGGIEQIKRNVAAYEAAYRGAKEADPDITVVATSIPADERYWELGYQQWADMFDFHVYESPDGVRQQIAGYQALMQKYGVDKPVISTELGLNSQGMSRSAVAAEMVRKFSAFFAAGGSEMAWFGVIYPDPEAKSRNSFGSAHNTFYCDYNLYCPKLDAVMLYTLTNAVCIKKFADEKRYAGTLRAFLFRDAEDRCLQMLYTDAGTRDVLLPLPGAATATLTRLDGSSVGLTPQAGAVHLRLSPEPVLLTYESSATTLPETLQDSDFQLEAPHTAAKAASIDLRVTGAAPTRLIAPYGWTVTPGESGYRVTIPADTEARAGRLYLQALDAAGAVCGEIAHEITLTGRVSVVLLPSPASGDQPPGVQLRLTNHEDAPTRLTWELQLQSAFPMADGRYDLGAPQPPGAHFAASQNGSLRLAAGATETITVPLAKVEPTDLYRVAATVTDSQARRIATERYVGGFAAAPRLTGSVAVDGVLDEADWQAAPPQVMTEPQRYFRFKGAAGVSLRSDAADLAAVLRTLWDDQYFYLAVVVTDDIHRTPEADAALWRQDSLQVFFDPARLLAYKRGYYDYGLALGAKGLQAWCFSSADTAVPAGDVSTQIRLGVQRDEATRRTVYEAAIPWERLRPFSPALGANLGMALIVNEDDGDGREAFFGWFSGAHEKQLDMVGDVTLSPARPGN